MLPRTTAAVLAILIATISSAWGQTQVTPGSAPGTPTATVVAVTSTDSNGRPSQFTNSTGRTFQISYDANGRPSSVLAVGTPNIADMVSIGYDPQGRLIGFTLRTGYTVYYSYRADGTQEIHDRLGGLLVRVPQGGGLYNIVSNSGSARLQDFVAAMDSLQSKLPLQGG